MRKQYCVMLIALFVLAATSNHVSAAGTPLYQAEAKRLKIMGVFQGTGSGFALDKEPTRIEGLVMMVRMLGKESEAKALSTQPCTFTDVPSWGIGYVNYAYQNGLTKGIGKQRFGSMDKMNAKSYITLLLRSLGYSDAQGDFTYGNSLEYAGQVGMISVKDISEISSGLFLRDHVAKLSSLALMAKTKTGDATLLEQLVENGAISGAVAAQFLMEGETETPVDPSSTEPSPSTIPTPVAVPLPSASTANVSEGKGIIIEKIDKLAEVVTLYNTSLSDIELAGYILVSVTGNQRFVFPAYVLRAGARMTVVSDDVKGDLQWTTANIWNNTKYDPGILYDATGKEISRFDK